MNTEYINITKELTDFIQSSPTAFQCTANIADMLDKDGYNRLNENENWTLECGKKYYVTRNMSSIIAFRLPENKSDKLGFTVSASHTDAPCYKLKTNCESEAFGKYVKLNTEGYGGMVVSSWVDRPLSIAGRVIVNDNGRYVPKMCNIDKDLVLIPNVAIHQNRNMNSGFAYNQAVDMMPLYAMKTSKKSIKAVIAENLGVNEESIVSYDMFLYNRTPATVWGVDDEFYSCPAIDNRQCAYSTFTGFMKAEKNMSDTVRLCASFDNEETGSATKQGAGSTFLYDVMSRICDYMGADIRSSAARSFMVSADNGHAKHPNHPELSDGMNSPDLNGGVVIKQNASQKYTTDAVSLAIFAEICKKADVPVQYFHNRSDMAGGSTLGSISDTRVAMNTVDIGMAQLAMHSSYETGGTMDTKYLIDAMTAFYNSELEYDGDVIVIK